MKTRKTVFQTLLVLAVISSAFFFSQSPPDKTNTTASPNITNYYYYNGERFYLNERTDMLFAQFKPGLTEQQAKSRLQSFPEIDASKPLEMDKANFIPLKQRLQPDRYMDLLSRMKQNDDFTFAGNVYSPLNVDDGKTFFGLSNEFIVQFKEHITSGQVSSINANNGVEILQQIDVSGGPTYLMKVNNSSPLTAMEMSNKYFEDGFANYSEPDLYCTNTLCDTTNDQYFFWQWSIRNLGNNVPTNPPGVIADCDMDVDSTWMVTQGDSTIKIAIVDTGSDTNHVDLAGNMTHGLGWDCADNDPWPQDGSGHGTSTAGIAAAVGNNTIGIAGIAYKCKLIPIRTIGSSGTSPYHVYACGFIRAWQYGADVISNSWGIIGGASSLLNNAISDAARFGRGGKGCVICFASGNENTTAMRFPSISHPHILVVGGLAPCNKRKSNTDGCSGETWGASYGTNLDVVAPCVKIYATTMGGGYTSSFNGTSSACPNAAGVCGLILSAFPNLTRLEVEAYISLSAEKVGTYNYDSVKLYGNWNQEMGYGRVNARLALQLASAGIDKTPPVIYHDSPVLSSPDSLTRIATAIIRDNRRVAIGTNAPRLYYRVGGGSFNFVNASSVSGDTFSFNIPGQSSGSTVQYYFAAQDTAAPPNISTLPAGGSGTNPPGTTPPATRFSYAIGTIKVAASTTTPKICPNSSTIYDTITIAPFSPLLNTVLDVDVKVNISHRTDSDVDLFLRKGASQSELTTDNGGSSDSYVETIFDDEGTIPITSGTPPYTGRFIPETPLSVFDGQTVDGIWIMQLTDDAAGDFGTLDGWVITITYETVIGTEEQVTIPSKFALHQNYPNPFNNKSKIKYQISKSGWVQLKLYDISGREVRTLADGKLEPGVYEITLDADELASGIYFYRMNAGDFEETRKLVLLK
jgi:subtilisin family serine protease/subtilisin-like proprotein convertase family protein